MLAGCIPVTTRHGALPEVVGNAGIYISSNKPEEIAAAIEQGLTLNGTCRQQAREQILTHFPLEKRQQGLYELVSQFVS